MEREAGVNPSASKYVLFSVCLPDATAQPNLLAVLDEDKKALSIASDNPNLRVLGFGSNPGAGQVFHGFSVALLPSYVQIVEYQGRWFVRDGYHRCFGLLSRGIHRIPCIFIRARNADEFGGNNPTLFFRWEILFGERPPFLKDLLDDAVSATGSRTATRKVVRISADEFSVQI